jgi:hypothetical protein
MEFLDILRSFLLVAHFVGLAAVIGPFILQMRWKGQYAFPVVFGGAITQLVTGLLLVGVAEMRAAQLDFEVDHIKVAVKLVIGLLVFVAALLGFLKQRKTEGGGGRELMPYFHTAGGLALINTALAVFW